MLITNTQEMISNLMANLVEELQPLFPALIAILSIGLLIEHLGSAFKKKNKKRKRK